MTYVVGAQYRTQYSPFGGTVYHYLCPDEIRLNVGDLAVVDSSNGAGLVRIHSLHSTSKQASAYVIQKVDMTAHQGLFGITCGFVHDMCYPDFGLTCGKG